MERIRLAIAGLGNMGATHAASLLAGRVAGLELAAVCDRDPGRLARFPGIPAYASAEAMIAAGGSDAILIATPHPSHVPLGIAALEAGLHVLMEKPLAVHKAEGERLIAAHRKRRQVFALMFNQRTDGAYRKIRQMVQDGELGEIRRVNWIITDWFRTEAYYASGGWRATWAGEGGGLLLNQCPHNLDLLQWIFGQPLRVRAQCRFGRYHDIEVEDDVTACLEFATGATGVFIASTGEAPGTNRLEIAAERGRLVFEDDLLVFHRNAMPMSEFSRAAQQSFAKPEVTVSTVTGLGHGGQHGEILQNFADAIRTGQPLIAPAAEGLRSLELANAMLLSTWLDRPVDLPLDAALYARHLQRRITGSQAKKRTAARPSPDDFAQSLPR